MNKAELIEAVSTQTSLQKADATRAVDAVFDSITSALKSGDTVALLGFGTFRRQSARRTRRTQSAHQRNDPDSGSKVPGFQSWQGLEGCCKISAPSTAPRPR
jgi:DNA-binding protein HU-beta